MERYGRAWDWEAKRDELRRRLDAVVPRSDHSGPLRPSTGMIVARDGTGEVAPELLIGLAGPPLNEYARHWDALGGPAEPDAAVPWSLERELLARFVETVVSEGTACGEWLDAWNFSFGEGWESVGDTDDLDAILRRGAVGGWSLLMAVYTLHWWRAEPLPAVDPPELVDVFVGWPGIADVDLGLEEALALPAVRWDPQGEERGVATLRIHDELRTAVRGELDRIETHARRVGTPSRAKRTGFEHLAWLARYQFRGESFAVIAEDVCRVRQSVMEGVKTAAELVGLPLRPPDRPGRPRKAPDAFRPARITAVPMPIAPGPIRTVTPSVGDGYRPALPLGIDRTEPAEG